MTQNRNTVRRRSTRSRRRYRNRRRMTILIPILLVIIAAVVVIALLSGGSDDKKVANTPDVVAAMSDTVDSSAGNSLTAYVSADPTVEPTASPTPAPTHFVFDDAYEAALRGESTGELIKWDSSGVNPEKLSRWPKVQEGYLPLIYAADTDKKIIAVTIDDCAQGENLRKMVQCALANNSKVTIFPNGTYIEQNSTVADVIRWAWKNGMEIENHTYNHEGLYHYDDARLRDEIWEQNAIVSDTLGVDYQMHFFRPKGGDERFDQRTHAYLYQQGYSGVVCWNHSGTSEEVSSMLKTLAPGNIYLFHAGDADLKKILKFIPGAVERGYKLVTLNEMFGLPENETSDLAQREAKPDLQSFKVQPIKMEKTIYLRSAAVIQKRLIELGWLEGNADGVFGDGSFKATGFFQMASGIKATGVADVATQKAMFAADAKRGTPELIAEYTAQVMAQYKKTK